MAKASIKSTMRTSVKGVLEILEDGAVYFVTEDARYSFSDIYGKFNNEEVDCVLTLKEEDE